MHHTGAQDDPDDWGREAPSMSTVYGGSSLNIAASGASNGSIGCFFKREKTWRCQIKVVINSEEEFYDVVPSLMYEHHFILMLSWTFLKAYSPVVLLKTVFPCEKQ
jgi:hypothetical protein